MPWAALEERWSDRGPRQPFPGDGSDSPAWSRKRAPYDPGAGGRDRIERGGGEVPYAELHCHSNFSFLDGASHPEELAEEAARLGLEALAVTDHDGFYGVVRFAEAARQVMNRADEHQIPGARKALGHAYGGGSQYFSMWVVGTDRPERHS